VAEFAHPHSKSGIFSALSAFSAPARRRQRSALSLYSSDFPSRSTLDIPTFGRFQLEAVTHEPDQTTSHRLLESDDLVGLGMERIRCAWPRTTRRVVTYQIDRNIN